MTYLQLVNAVLKRMREPTVATVTENAHSTLVGEFVNDAKRIVEDAWQWRILGDSVTATTVAGTSSFDLEDLTGSNHGTPRERTRLMYDYKTSRPLIRITTAGFEQYILFDSQGYKYIDRQIESNTNFRATPETLFLGVNTAALDGNTNLRAFLNPTPDAVYAVQLHIVNPQNDLTENNTALLIPHAPVIQLAYLFCLYERGEELGERLTLTETKANQALADAIMFDAVLQGISPQFTPPESYI